MFSILLSPKPMFGEYRTKPSVDKSIEISEIKLIEKFGGKSGHYILS